MSKSNRADSSCSRKSDNTLLQLPNDVLGIAKNRLSSFSIKFRGPSEPTPKSPDLNKAKSKSSSINYFRKQKPKNKNEPLEFYNTTENVKEGVQNGSKNKFQRQTSIDIVPKSRPISMVANRQKSVDDTECARSYPGTSSHKIGFFSNRHEITEKSPVDDGRKPAIESICLFPRLVFPVHSSALATSSITLNSDSLERPRKKLSFREPEIVEVKKTSTPNSPRKIKQDMFAALSDVSEDKSEGMASVQSYPYPGEEFKDCDLESQAMRIVRTVGQAFEVCHKLSPEPAGDAASSSGACGLSHEAALSISDKVSEISDKPKKESGAIAKVQDFNKGQPHEVIKDEVHPILEPPPKPAFASTRPQRPTRLDVDITLAPTPRGTRQTMQSREATPLPGYTDRCVMTTPQATEHREKFLEESLEQQRQQTCAATAQLALLSNQLVVEKAARIEAQARTHELLLHNKELIDHISMLVAHLQERERGAGSLPYSLSAHQLTCVPQLRREVSLSDTRAAGSPALPGPPSPSPSPFGQPLLPPSPSLRLEPNNNSAFSTLFANQQFGYPPASPKRLNTLTTSPNTFADRQNANDLTDFLMNLVNQQSPGNAPPQSPSLQRHTADINLYSGLNSPRMGNVVPPLELVFDEARESPMVSVAEIHGIENKRMEAEEGHFIRPLSQIGTITTIDEDGRVRIVVPTKKSAQPVITRTTSERVPNKSVLMAQVRDQWGRHTTK